MKYFTPLIIFSFSLATVCARAAPSAAVDANPAFIPLPAQAHVTHGPGFALGEALPVHISRSDQQAAKQVVLASFGLAGVKTATAEFPTNALCATLDASKKDAIGTEGYVQRAVHDISEVVGQWSPKEVTTEWKTVEWAIPASMAPNVAGVLISYTGGAHRLEIQSAELVVDGKVMAQDKHFGIASAPGTENTYKLAVPAGTACNICALRAIVRTDGGNDSKGIVGLLKSR